MRIAGQDVCHRFLKIPDIVLFHRIVGHILTHQPLSRGQHLYLRDQISIRVIFHRKVLSGSVFQLYVGVQNVALNDKVPILMLIGNGLCDILNQVEQADIGHIQIDIPLVGKADLEIERAVVDLIAGKHAHFDPVQPIHLDRLACVERRGYNLIKIVQISHIVRADSVIALLVSSEAPLDQGRLLTGNGRDLDLGGVRIACQPAHQRHALRDIQCHVVIRQNKFLGSVVRDIELDVKEFLQVGNLRGNIQERNNICAAISILRRDDGRR